MRHPCRATGCPKRIPEPHTFCGRHNSAIPKELHVQINKGEDGAVREAVAYLRRREFLAAAHVALWTPGIPARPWVPQ